MTQLIQLKPTTAVEKRTKTVTDTIVVTPESVGKWLAPPFQRPLKTNHKVMELAQTLLTENGVIPGVITLGVLDGQTYLLDGQHRIAAFRIAELKEGYTDIRKHYFDTMAEMGNEWVKLNSQLVRMSPDDILRGLEGSNHTLQAIRKHCSFVGYDQVRRGDGSPILSMSVAVRCWRNSLSDIPAWSSEPARDVAVNMSQDETQELCAFLQTALGAFGRDHEYARLWSAINLTLCMWLYRKMVKAQWSPKVPRMDHEMFRKCLTALSADNEYLDWLVGRRLTDRDRGPAYSRVRKIFIARIFKETGKRVMMPQPAWASSH